MPYRPRSTALWFNLPGIITAYQPVGAPGPLLARQNVSHDARRAGVHTAKDGAAPSWAAHTGWTFNTSQYLLSSAVPTSQNTSMLVQFSNHLATGYSAICGWELLYTATVGLSGCWGGASNIYFNGTDGVYLLKSPQLLAGNLAYAGLYAYRNGIAESGSFTPGWAGTFTTIKIGGSNAGGGEAWTGSIQAYAFVDHTLSPAEVMLAARQMAYCHVNPDWSAWGRRRRYYYNPPDLVAPPVTADDIRSAAAGVGAFGPRLGGAARMGHQQAAELPAAARAGHRSRLNG